MSEKQIVKDLQNIQPKLEGEHSDVASMREATTLLARLAKSLHEMPAVRRELGAGVLPGLLASLLDSSPTAPAASDIEMAAGTAFFEMVGQTVYAASGLVEGDNEANANRLYDAMFPHNCMVFLFNATQLPMQVWRGYIVGPWAPLVSILLKLTLFEGPKRNELCIPTSVESFVELAFKAYTPGEWGKLEKDITRATLVEYLLHTVVNISTAPTFNLPAPVTKNLVPSFQLWTGTHKSNAPAGLSSFSDEEAHTSLGREFSILYHSASILHNFTQAGKIDHATLVNNEDALRGLVAFIEKPAVPAWIDQNKLTAQTKEGMTSVLASTKDMVTNFVLTLISNPKDEVPTWLWDKVTEWLNTPGMLDIGLAALANGARDDAKSHALLVSPSKLPERLASLLNSSPNPAVQHALVGLIRNLTVNKANRPLLGAEVVDGILSLDPWQPARDSLDRLQRDAMIALSNLSTDPALAAQIMSNEKAISSLLALQSRTSLGGVKGLAASSLAQIVSHLPETGADAAWTNAGTTPVLMSFGTLTVAVDDPALLETALLALLHIAKHSAEDAQRVATTLKMNIGGKTPLRVVTGILAPPPLDAPPTNAKVEGIALELVKVVGNEGITQAVKGAAEANRALGRAAAAGVETL